MRRSSALLVLFAIFALSAAPALAHHVREGLVGFKTLCGYSHSSNDDPIVFPGRRGATHRHDFFGAAVTDAFTSSVGELFAARTTCRDRQDHAAYWTPTVYAGGRMLTPDKMTAYYRRNERHGTFAPYPAGLRVVAGAPAPGHFGYNCENEGQNNAFGQTTAPAACPNGRLRVAVAFPDCWDGRRTDSPDHRSHMAYSARSRNGPNVCPPSHPVQVPQLQFFAVFTAPQRPITLSSGAADTLHADFFNAWDERRLQDLIDRCLNADRQCNAIGQVVQDG